MEKNLNQINDYLVDKNKNKNTSFYTMSYNTTDEKSNHESSERKLSKNLLDQMSKNQLIESDFDSEKSMKLCPKNIDDHIFGFVNDDELSQNNNDFDFKTNMTDDINKN
jgi:hypothetical protein